MVRSVKINQRNIILRLDNDKANTLVHSFRRRLAQDPGFIDRVAQLMTEVANPKTLVYPMMHKTPLIELCITSDTDVEISAFETFLQQYYQVFCDYFKGYLADFLVYKHINPSAKLWLVGAGASGRMLKSLSSRRSSFCQRTLSLVLRW